MVAPTERIYRPDTISRVGQCSEAALRYTLRARNSAGTVDFLDKLVIDAALRKAAELRDAGFQHVTLINVESGVEITDLEQVMRGR